MRVPLVYKPGILRDGSKFQDEYCIDGQWIRFVGGKIRKMKGQQEIITESPVDNVVHMDIEDGVQVSIFFSGTDYIKRGIFKNGSSISNIVTALTLPINEAKGTWQTVKFTKDSEPYIGFLGLNNGIDIEDKTQGEFFYTKLDDINQSFSKLAIGGDSAGIVSGGILYSNPSLYLYGNNGTILRSRTNDPLNFSGGDSDKYVIDSDKILFGSIVRGGSNSPNFLFWTSNSVIYLTNVSDGNAPVDFQKEVITSNSSLISSRAVVQYDSLFFWLGTDRIFVYNGIVDTVPNTINWEYFLDNVDFNKRQKIYGYRVARYGEVRWAYPEMQYSDDPDIGCTRELVYNVRENSWNDTAIQRDCVTVFKATGQIFSFGEAASNFPFNPGNSYKRIWKQETGWEEIRDGARLNIPSFFTTPYYGYAAFNPAKSGAAIERYITLEQIEPDFPADVPRSEDDELRIIVSYKKYASRAAVTTNPVIFKLGDSIFSPNLGKVDIRVTGRFMNITFVCDFPYEVGTTLLEFKEGSGQ